MIDLLNYDLKPLIKEFVLCGTGCLDASAQIILHYGPLPEPEIGKVRQSFGQPRSVKEFVRVNGYAP